MRLQSVREMKLRELSIEQTDCVVGLQPHAIL